MHGNIKKISSLLLQYDQNVPPDKWVILPFKNGTQAKIFLAYIPQMDPEEELRSKLVIKLFNTKKENLKETLKEEYESLSLLGNSFQHFNVNGWNISVPRPLLLTDNPSALIMSYVQGISLEKLLLHWDQNKRFDISALHNPIISSLQRYWTDHNRIYGDLNCSNILCAIQSKNIFFVDPGAPNPSYNLKFTSKVFFPASHDLGYWLFEVCATNTKIQIFSPDKARRRGSFVKQLIHCYMHYFVQEPRIEPFLDELNECAKFHVSRIKSSWGLRGVWTCYVARRTLLNLSQEIADIRKQLGRSNNLGNCNVP